VLSTNIKKLIYSYENPQKLLTPCFFGSDMHQIVCRPHWGNLQCSSRPPSWFRGWSPRGREGGVKGRRRERKGREWKGKGEEGMKGEAGDPQNFRWIDAFDL